jgi:hypothetical protein
MEKQTGNFIFCVVTTYRLKGISFAGEAIPVQVSFRDRLSSMARHFRVPLPPVWPMTRCITCGRSMSLTSFPGSGGLTKRELHL